MLGPFDYLLWLVCLLIEGVALACLIWSRSFTRYFTLALYLSVAIATGAGRYLILTSFGYTSSAYYYFYFSSDFLLTISMYFVLMSLYAHVFSDMGVGKYLRGGALLLLAGATLISYRMVTVSSDLLLTRFVVELSRNLYFVGLLLIYLLWGAMIKMKENRTRLMQLVLSMGIFFSAFASSYALENLFPDFMLWRYVSHMMAIWLPLSWAYTFIRVAEDARMDTLKVLAPERASRPGS